MTRARDCILAAAGLVVVSPLLAAIAFLIWIADFHSPLFRGPRVARGGGEFRILKFRTMAPEAWKSGVNSTAAGDPRVTPLGNWLRRSKLDELPQLVNVLTGEMSLVGPRPQTLADAALYTQQELRIFDVRPGITDLASIVFADEAAILGGSQDPDLLYQQIVRPWKSRLALLYIEHHCSRLDWRILWFTGLALVSRRRGLAGVGRILDGWDADETVRRMARRREPLLAYAPPGAGDIVCEYPRPRPAEVAVCPGEGPTGADHGAVNGAIHGAVSR